MAAIAIKHRNTANRTDAPFTPPGYAQGEEGQFLENSVFSAAERWMGQSEYVAAMLVGRAKPTSTKRMLVLAGLLAGGCAGLSLCGWIAGFGAIFYPLAAAAGLAAYVLLARWVATQNNRSGVLWFGERIRRAIAYEGDPGHRES